MTPSQPPIAEPAGEQIAARPPASASSAPPARPVRVAHVLHTVAFGGIETILLNWLTTLDPNRVAASIVVFANPGETEKPFVDAAERAGLSVARIPWARRKPVFKAARALRTILRERDIEIAHCHNVYAEIVGYLAARKTGAKVMNTLYVWSDFGFRRNVQQWVSARLIRRFDLVTSQCEMTQRETIRRGVPEAKQRVLISGVRTSDLRLDDAERRARREALGARDADIVLVNVARLYPEKRQDLLLRWFVRLARERPCARLWILGAGPLETDLRNLADALGVADRVAFPGFRRDLAETMLAADVQVHTSDAEGVPLAICEGMAVGMPIVATSVGGIPEMITHGESGLLLPARDEEAFIRESLRLIDDPHLRRTLGEGARRFIETRYSLEVAVDQLAATYEQLAR